MESKKESFAKGGEAILTERMNKRKRVYDTLAKIARYHLRRFEDIGRRNREQAQAHFLRHENAINSMEKVSIELARYQKAILQLRILKVSYRSPR